MTQAQIEQKKLQLKQLVDKAQQLKKELVEAGAWPLDENDLDQAAGGAHKKTLKEEYMEMDRELLKRLMRPL